MPATTRWKDDEYPRPSPKPTPPLAGSAVSSLSGSGGIRKTTIARTKKRTQLRISGPAPTHHLRAIYERKITDLEDEVNRLRNWWWVDMMDHPPKRDWGQDTRWSEIYKREHWVRGMELAANGWVQADFAREKMMQGDIRVKVREARKAKEAAKVAKEELAAVKIELAGVKRELEEKKEQDAVDRQLAMTMLAATQ